MTHPEIDRYVKDADIELTKLKEAETKAKAKQSQNASKQSKHSTFHHSNSLGPSSNAFNNSYHLLFKKSFNKNLYNHSNGLSHSYDPKVKRSHKWNFKFC